MNPPPAKRSAHTSALGRHLGSPHAFGCPLRRPSNPRPPSRRGTDFSQARVQERAAAAEKTICSVPDKCRKRRLDNGAMVVALTEIVPPHVRTAGFSVAYSLATAIFGGFTPAVATYLFHVTENRAVAGLWLMFAAACSLVATLLAFRMSSALKPDPLISSIKTIS